MLEIVWSRPALAHVNTIGDFLTIRSPSAAANTIGRIEQRVFQLASFPDLGRPGREPDTRELSVAGTKYIISYRVVARRIIRPGGRAFRTKLAFQ